MSKKKSVGPQAAAAFETDSIYAGGKGKTRPQTAQSEPAEVNKGGRPKKWTENNVKRYTVILTPEQWDMLDHYAALAKVQERVKTDRSGVLRALINKLAAGDVRLSADDYARDSVG